MRIQSTNSSKLSMLDVPLFLSNVGLEEDILILGWVLECQKLKHLKQDKTVTFE